MYSLFFSQIIFGMQIIKKCDVMVHGLIGFIGYYCQQGITSLPEAHPEGTKMLSMRDG
jgi:hypothetical protein